jgi:hypothetical protein
MRLQDYSSFFRPEEIGAMTAAYDAAWQHIRTSVRLHGATGLGAAKRDCITRRLRATTPRAARFAASAIRPLGHVVLQPTSCTSAVPPV